MGLRPARDPNRRRSSEVPVTEKAVRNALKTVKDPELNLDLVVLGLVYDIEVEGSTAKATISLTTPMCPAAGQILDDAKAAVASVDGVEDAQVELTFEPPWTPERISPLIRSALGI
ncbi:MAG: metal-sulfur cluster assembly factor [Gemmatimonadota bacterium]|nr:metal-sulfur cluster assembly factor [Gemmatimonadota bacterium]